MKTIVLILIVTTCAIFAQEVETPSTSPTSQPTTQSSDSNKGAEVDLKKLKNKLKHEAEVAHSKERVPLLLAKEKIVLQIKTIEKENTRIDEYLIKNKDKKGKTSLKCKEFQSKKDENNKKLNKLNKYLSFADKNILEHNKLKPGVDFFKKLRDIYLKDGQYGQILGGFYKVIKIEKEYVEIDIPIEEIRTIKELRFNRFKEEVSYSYKRVRLLNKGKTLYGKKEIYTKIIHRVSIIDNILYLVPLSF